MAPKKKQKDISSYFEKKNGSPGSSSRGSSVPGGASTSETPAPGPVRMKEENKGSEEPHNHQFRVQFSPSDKYNIDCVQPCSVLKAIRLKHSSNKVLRCADENVIIKMGTGDDESIIPTHFPCTCIGDGEILVLSRKPNKVEKMVSERCSEAVHPKDKYSVFYIDTKGGINAIKKKLFISESVKRFKYLCVYGEKDITVEEALKRDGRFKDNLGCFELMNIDDEFRTNCTDKIESLDNKKLKICFKLQKDTKGKETNLQSQNDQQITPHASNTSWCKTETSSITAVVQQKGISITGKGDNTKEIYERLRKQFPDLKKWMESRFPGDLYQETLKLRKENFGKIQQSFSEVHRVRKLLELGKSVCKVTVKDVSKGTGFVLFDNFILTSAHLFKGYVEGKKLLQQDIEVSAKFNYEEPEAETNAFSFRANNTFVDFDDKLDYAVLELKLEARNIEVPAGLLSRFGPLPPSGEACIIGHPAGGVKKMDPTWIIEAEKRGQAIDEYLHPYRDTLFTIQSIRELIKKQGIETILESGDNAGKVGTYHTFMYHGASGSPVFDGLCRIFGLHTAGFTYGFKNDKSVIEYGQPLVTIFKSFVGNLKESGNELLKKVEEAAQENPHLKEILHPEEPMDLS